MNTALKLAEKERQYTAQALHDDIVQTLLQINMQVGICQKFLEMDAHDMLESELRALSENILTASRQAREIINDLRPPQDTHLPLDEMVASQIDIHLERGGAPVNYTHTGEGSLSYAQRLSIIRILQEALTNSRKHAQASLITVNTELSADTCQLTIIDNGKGFDIEKLPPKRGAGIALMTARADAMNATFAIKSHPQHGTLIQITLPL